MAHFLDHYRPEKGHLNSYGKSVTSDFCSTIVACRPETDFLPTQSDFSDKLLDRIISPLTVLPT
jgi:hypothetical protein